MCQSSIVQATKISLPLPPSIVVYINVNESLGDFDLAQLILPERNLFRIIYGPSRQPTDNESTVELHKYTAVWIDKFFKQNPIQLCINIPEDKI